MTKDQKYRLNTKDYIHPMTFIGLYDNIDLDKIMDVVADDYRLLIIRTAEFYDVTYNDVISHCRKREYTLPRQVSMYLLRKYTDLSLWDIGQLLGGRDHSTVLYSLTVVDNLISTNFKYKKKLNQCSGYVLKEMPYMKEKYLKIQA